MAERLLLFTFRELTRRRIDVPLHAIARRLNPGASGADVRAFLRRTLRTLVAEGHIAPSDLVPEPSGTNGRADRNGSESPDPRPKRVRRDNATGPASLPSDNGQSQQTKRKKPADRPATPVHPNTPLGGLPVRPGAPQQPGLGNVRCGNMQGNAYVWNGQGGADGAAGLGQPAQGPYLQGTPVFNQQHQGYGRVAVRPSRTVPFLA